MRPPTMGGVSLRGNASQLVVRSAVRREGKLSLLRSSTLPQQPLGRQPLGQHGKTDVDY